MHNLNGKECSATATVGLPNTSLTCRTLKISLACYPLRLSAYC